MKRERFSDWDARNVIVIANERFLSFLIKSGNLKCLCSRSAVACSTA